MPLPFFYKALCFAFRNSTQPRKVEADALQRLQAENIALRQENLKLSERIVELELNAKYDELTGLSKKEVLLAIGATALEDAKNRDGVFSSEKRHILDHAGEFSIIFIDLNGFKKINDKLGHEAGDEVLQFFASKLENTFQRKHDIVARTGGDEIVLLIPNSSESQISERLDNLNNICRFELTNPENVGTSVQVHFSYGISSYRDQDNLLQMIAEADQAMYANKAAAKARHADDLDQVVSNFQKPENPAYH